MTRPDSTRESGAEVRARIAELRRTYPPSRYAEACTVEGGTVYLFDEGSRGGPEDRRAWDALADHHERTGAGGLCRTMARWRANGWEADQAEVDPLPAASTGPLGRGLGSAATVQVERLEASGARFGSVSASGGL